MMFENSNYLCIGLTETWLTALIKDDMIKIKGYTVIRLDRCLKKRGGGILFFIRSDLVMEPSITLPSISTSNIEILNIVLRRPYQKSLCVSTVYIPPTVRIAEAIDCLDKVAKKITELGLDWVMGGDFNINLLTSGNSGKKKSINNFASRNSLVQLINSATRITTDTRSLIDHIYVNVPDKVTEAGILSYALSDHQATFIVINKNLPKKPKISFKCRNMKNYQAAFVRDLLGQYCWNDFYATEYPEHKWEIMLNHFTTCVNLLAPLIELENVPEKEPWVTPDLLRLIRERNQSQQEYLNLGDQCDRNALNAKIAKYHELRNKVQREVMKSKRSHVVNKVSLLDNSSKKFWKELHNIAPIGKKSMDNSSTSNIILSKDNEELIEENKVCEFMNDYFIAIGKDLASKITIDNSFYVKRIQDEPVINMEHWDRVNEAETLLLVQDLDANKNSNINELNSTISKDCLLGTIDKLTHLFNSILLTGYFPDSWKRGTVVPLFKCGNKQKVNNYRPVCLLPVIGKLMEKVIHRRILIFLDSKNYFTDREDFVPI